jgi:predicted nucleic acid-binding protein
MLAEFLDSNVILYFASRDPAKADRAEALMQAGGVVSVQVLNEIANVGRKKLRLSWDELDDVMKLVRVLVDVVPLVAETHDRGIAIARRYGLAIYDSMIVAAAQSANCETLWSEDMQDGLVVDGALTIRNPFV